MVQKRRRKATSCIDCRRRKVKCDRTVPACMICQKRGNAQTCRYVSYRASETSFSPYLSESPKASQGSAGAHAAHDGTERAHPSVGIAYAANTPETVSQFETSLRLKQKLTGPHEKSKSSSSRPDLPAQSGVTAAARDVKPAMLRGSGFKTLYHGPSHYASILLAFDELARASKDLMKGVKGSWEEGRRVKSQLETVKVDMKQELATLTAEHSAMLRLLPVRIVVDSLIQTYMATIETTYRVLHVPTFWKQYEMFWQNPQESPTSFVVVLLLSLSVVNCVEPRGELKFVGRCSISRKQAIEWVSVSESWLQSQSHKHISLVVVQIRLLIFLAKRMNSIKVKRAWNSAGDLLRLAMAAGLHREPSQMTKKISVFDQEIRRRIWATTIELELLASTDAGMLPSISPDDWDCQPPSNIHDEDFDEDCQILPPCRPLWKFTRASFLCESSRSVGLRGEVLRSVNRIKGDLTLDEVAAFDVRLRSGMAEIAAWSEDKGSFVRSASRLANTLARLQLLESLTLVHQPFATSEDEPGRHFFSRTAFRDAAANTLELYKDAEDWVAFTMCFQRNDLLRAGLCICFELCFDPGSVSSVLFDRDKSLDLLEYATQLYEDRIMRLGEGHFAFLIMLTALDLARSKRGRAVESWRSAPTAAQRIVNSLRTMMQLQAPVTSPQKHLRRAGSTVEPTQPVMLDVDSLAPPLELPELFDFPTDVSMAGLPDFWAMDALLYEFDCL